MYALFTFQFVVSDVTAYHANAAGFTLVTELTVCLLNAMAPSSVVVNHGLDGLLGFYIRHEMFYIEKWGVRFCGHYTMSLSQEWEYNVGFYAVPIFSCFFKTNFTFSALMLLVGWQEGHLACKNEWLGTGVVMSGPRCRFVYRPADATATHCLMLL